MGKHLTDDQLKIILESQSFTDRALAKHLGASRSAVGYARRNLLAGKWVCAVRFEPCRRCGETVTIRGPHNNQFYHLECARQNQRDAANRYYAVNLKKPKRPSVNELRQQANAAAVNQRSRWTAEDDAVVREMVHLPWADTAFRLGRTIPAVIQRRKRLSRLRSSQSPEN